MEGPQTISDKISTKQLWEKDRQHFIHPYANYNHFQKEGSVIYAAGKDHFIFDHDGKEYLDGIAGWMNLIIS